MTRLGRLIGRWEVFLVLVLIGAFVYGTWCSEYFLTASNISIAIAGATPIAIVALGMTLVIVTGEIDVSVGSMLALAGFVAGPIAVKTDDIWLTLGVGIGVGIGGGLLNGLVVAYTRVPSIVATLGTLYAFQGLALLVSRSRNVVSVPEHASVLGAG
ncbi:MAG TPA: hypothetical protein VHQ91_15165, partial [Geminicoccaceae bacterium]|nr:hypothetical protein [Geminicoccaceae bacterium]